MWALRFQMSARHVFSVFLSLDPIAVTSTEQGLHSGLDVALDGFCQRDLVQSAFRCKLLFGLRYIIGRRLAGKQCRYSCGRRSSIDIQTHAINCLEVL